MMQQSTQPFFRALIRGLAFPAAVLAIHALTLAFYEAWWPYDIPMHFLGGVSIAVGGAVCIASWKGASFLGSVPGWFVVMFLVGLTMIFGVLWEFVEFGSDWILHTVNQQGLRDTMGDLAMDLLGGVVGAAAGLRILRKK